MVRARDVVNDFCYFATNVCLNPRNVENRAFRDRAGINVQSWPFAGFLNLL